MSDDAPHDGIAPPAFLAAGAPAAVLAALPNARAVGGCVRDAIAGLPVHDVDIAAPLPPDDIARRLRDAGLTVFETGLSHGTVTAVLDHQPVEVTALRRDVATDGRHAEVAWTTDWRVDAERRDFTINAMSCDAAGALWDYFYGRADLAAGRVRFVGDAATRLREDYLRALRFFRFWARYGRGAPDADAIAAIRDAVEGLRARIAPERIWMELKRLLAAPDPVAALELMEATGIRDAALPEAVGVEVLRRLIALDAPPDPLLRLAATLPPGDAHRRIAARLRLSGEEAARLRLLLDHAPPDAATLRRFRAQTASLGPADDVLWLAEARDGADRAALRARVHAEPVPVFPLHGRDLLALGVEPGVGMGAALNKLKQAWLDSDCTLTRDELLSRVERRDPNRADLPNPRGPHPGPLP